MNILSKFAIKKKTKLSAGITNQQRSFLIKKSTLEANKDQLLVLKKAGYNVKL